MIGYVRVGFNQEGYDQIRWHGIRYDRMRPDYRENKGVLESQKKQSVNITLISG